MLSSTSLFDAPGLSLYEVRCAHARGPWAPTETTCGAAVIFARRGAFRRRTRAGEQVVEPGVAVLQRVGEDEEYAHPHDGGDDCTVLRLSPALLADVLGEPDLPAGVVATSPGDDLAHRAIVAAARRGEDVEEHLVSLLASVLGTVAPVAVAHRRPATGAARRSLAGDAREAFARDPSLGLVALGRAIGASPHHLSRVFAAEVGVSVSMYRRGLRLRAALERIHDADLSRVAADAGYADHAHLAREARALVGETPSSLRGKVSGPVQQAGQRPPEHA